MRYALAAALLALAATPADAGETSGSAALALAALIGPSAPALTPALKSALAGMGDGRVASGAPIQFTVDSVSCRAGNVDISLHRCELKFGARTVTFGGRRAHEIYATLLEAGVEPDGAAGTIYANAAKVTCEVKPSDVADRAGGGAHCAWADDQ